MSAYILRRISTRPALLHSSPRRHATTTQGTPNASNVSNPQSVSTEQSDIKTSRATDSTPNVDSASTQSPVSGDNMQGGKTENPDDHEGKRDPSKPAGQKREEVLRQGDRPLGVEDKQ